MRQEEGLLDVAIAGFGPVGAALCGLLGASGLRVGVFERASAVHPEPRAVGFDHDAMRIFQQIGVASALAPHVAPFRNAEYIGAGGQVIQRVRHMDPPYPLGWSPNYSCNQPGVEAVLRSGVARMASVQTWLGHELADFRDEGDCVRLEVREPGGALRRHRARYLVGCDGASSAVRRRLGIALESMDYDEPWIVVDVQVEARALAKLPATNVQYCDPRRPSTFVVCPGNHRRWEFMRLEGEACEGALPEEKLWQLLARWLAPGEARIWRAAAYRFHALIAREWRRGRVLLAGDSAHQTPPFLGQGMCQGIRDAGNLAWKLARVLRGLATPGLLDTYAEERRPHVQATTRIARELGALVSERDPERARARDARMLANGGGEAPTAIRQNMIPGLAAGFIAAGTPMAGESFPQPWTVDAGGERRLFDDLAPGFRMVVDETADEPELHALAARHALPVIAARREEGRLVRDRFAQAECRGVVVRPDHYVFGGFSTLAQARELLGHLAAYTPLTFEPMEEVSG